MLHQFSQVLSQIYAASTDHHLWRSALGAIEQFSGSAGVVVNMIDKAEPQSSVLLNSRGIEDLLNESEVDTYNHDVLPHCPRVTWGAAHPFADYVCDYMILSEADMNRDVAYSWYQDHGLRYFVGSPLFQTSRHHFMWSLQRTPKQAHVQGSDIQLFKLLKPHVSRALQLAEQLGTLRSFQHFSSSVLGTLPQAVFALGANGAVLFANSAAESLLRRADGLSSANGKLRGGLPNEQSRLDRLIREAAHVDMAASSGWMRLSRANGGAPYAIFVAPLNIADEGLIATQAKVLVMVHDTAEHRTADPHMLTELYELTEAEARLASALSGGHSLESAAALLGVRPATVRTQLKSVFRKTGVSRQQDLVRLLASLATMSKPRGG